MSSLMIQGTSSDAGKSAVVAGLCRLFARRGVRVAPFKPQNMALNSAVTIDGGEIGRAQAVQAQAAGVEPHTDMNPVLLKPSTDVGAQVIVHGKVLTQMDARGYHAFKPHMMAPVLESFQRLQSQYDLVLVEGAGSPAEINLRDGDLANMGFAEAADCPVWLVGDIDRGGVFAQLIGTMELLSTSEQARIEAFIINRFRGDVSLLDSGLDYLTGRTGVPVVGVLPYLEDLHLEAEDSLARSRNRTAGSNALRVAVPVLPRMSNHTDLDPLALHPRVELDWVERGQPIAPCDLIILPGSKSVRQDLRALHEQGWTKSLYRHLRYGGKVLGLCGGYQMLGTTVRDPDGIEGPPGASAGLGLLSVETTLETHKQLRRVSGHLTLDDARVDGYEIHMGNTAGADLERPLVRLADRTDGAMSADGLVIGTYLHGLLEAEPARRAILAWAGLGDAAAPDYRSIRDQAIDRLADMLEEHFDAEALNGLVVPSQQRVKTSFKDTRA